MAFRLGCFQRVLGPGLHWILPGVDRVLRVCLDRVLPDWRQLGAEEIRERLGELARQGREEALLR